ncbi:MAG: alpha/beta hydrolase family protein [Dysosmobacter welbionis]
MEGTADIGYYFAKGQTGASHREDRSPVAAVPFRYADHVTTPTLFLHGEEDYRCWKLEAIQMFTALQLRGVPSRLCLFPGENHELSRSGRPRQRLRRLEEMLRWYQRYLNKQEA